MSKAKKLGKGLEAILGVDLANEINELENDPTGIGENASKKKKEPAFDTSFEEDLPEVPVRKSGKKTLAEFYQPETPPPATAVENVDVTQQIYQVSVSLIDSNPWQPRSEFGREEIRTLAESISDHGLLQPIVLRRDGERYQLVAGERRFRAAMHLNWTEVPAMVLQADDREMAELALIENLHRKDLNAIEKAISFQNYLEQHQCTQEELAGRIHIDRSTIANFLRLLDLPQEIQKEVIAGRITQGHARALLPLVTKQEQMDLCERIIEENLTVRQVEIMVTEWNETDRGTAAKTLFPEKTTSLKTKSAPVKTSRLRKRSPQIVDLEHQFREALGLKVRLTADDHGKGKIEIFFRNHDEFESLLDYFQE
ncbi:MAG: ParB/RepB/Spo0J family partition protein [Planctomycetia bacterium]|nr:ParB/RepB/Spo0J family partition protein [Planctomycetia bacterium]